MSPFLFSLCRKLVSVKGSESWVREATGEETNREKPWLWINASNTCSSSSTFFSGWVWKTKCCILIFLFTSFWNPHHFDFTGDVLDKYYYSKQKFSQVIFIDYVPYLNYISLVSENFCRIIFLVNSNCLDFDTKQICLTVYGCVILVLEAEI